MSVTYVGIQAVNSPDYFLKVAESYRKGEIVVPLFGGDIKLPEQIQISRVVTPNADGNWLQEDVRGNPSTDIAQISFSSGTEGAPKGIAISHRALLDVVERLNTYMRVDDTIREYIGIPVYFSFGLARCRAVCQAGGAAYIPSNGFKLTEFLALLERGEVNALSAVPTLLRLVIKNERRFAEAGKRLKWLEIGSQYISRDEKEALKRIFPNAVILLNYGLTEASRSTLQIVSEDTGAALDSVGRAEGDIEVALTDTGRIKIRGPNLASYLLVDGEQRPLTDDDGWFVTGDVGEIVDERLYYRGRADDIINCAGKKISSEVLEQKILKEAGENLPIAVVGIPDPMRGERVFVAVERGEEMPLDRVRELAEGTLAKIDASIAGAVSVGEVDALPRTHTNKVKRKALQKEVIARLEATGAATPRTKAADDPSSGVLAQIVQVFEAQFPGDDISPEDTFDALGGTSMDFIEVDLELETILGSAPGDWNQMTLAQLAALSDQDALDSSGGKAAKTYKLDQLGARALCCILVVFAHVVGDNPQAGLSLPMDHWLHTLNEFMGYFKMPLFAFLSGLTFQTIGSAEAPPRAFFGSLAKTIVLPSIVAMVLFAIATNSLGGSYSNSGGGPGLFFLSSYAHFWFIQSLIVILLVSYALLYLLGDAARWPLLAVLLSPMIFTGVFMTPFFALDGVAVLAPFFAFGLVFGQRSYLALSRTEVILVAVASLAAATAAVALYASGHVFLYMPHWGAFLIGLPLIIAVLLLSTHLKLLKPLAPFTFYIFLFHVFGTSGARRALERLGEEDLTVHLVVGTLVGVVVPVCIALAVRKLSPAKFIERRMSPQ